MCFMTPACDLDTMITCHRYKPNPVTAAAVGAGASVAVEKLVAAAAHKGGKELAALLAGTPKKMYHPNKGYYKVHSSFWNGTHSDTNNLY